MQINEQEHVEILRQMLRIRRFEENLYQMYLNKQVPGMSPHLSVGQEAVAAGVCHAMRKEDYLLTTHRGHGHVLAKGANMNRMLAEILGKESGYCHGRGGSMHIADVSLNIVGANGIVGGGLPIAVGVALSCVYQKKDAVVVCFFGDAAANIGSFHESLNMSGGHEPARRVGVREQSVRFEHVHRKDVGGRVDRLAGRRLRHGGVRDRRQQRSRRARRGHARRSTAPARAAARR